MERVYWKPRSWYHGIGSLYKTTNDHYVYCCILIYRLAQNVNNEYNRPTWEAYSLEKSNYTLCRTHPSLLSVNHVCIVDHCKTGLVSVDLYTCDFSDSLWSRVPPILRSCHNVMCKLRGISVRGGIITLLANESNRFQFSG